VPYKALVFKISISLTLAFILFQISVLTFQGVKREVLLLSD
jgi:hypothetical protein